jgi:hypothetical protein
MSDDLNANPQSPTSQSPAPTATPAADAEPTPDLLAQPQRPAAKVITIPSNAMAQIKRDEREKGRKAVQLELEDRARKAGFSNLEEMEMAAKRARNQQQPRQQAPVQITPQTANASTSVPSERNLRRAEKERDRALEEVRKANRSRAAEEKRRKDAEKRVASMEAEMSLRTAAVRAGVRDVDYALELLRRKIQGKSPEELRAFNEEEFFAKELRGSAPYLYGVTDSPVNTQTAATAAPPPAKGVPSTMPAPQPGAQQNGHGDPVDARRLSGEEYSKLLSKLGVRRAGL